MSYNLLTLDIMLCINKMTEKEFQRDEIAWVASLDTIYNCMIYTTRRLRFLFNATIMQKKMVSVYGCTETPFYLVISLEKYSREFSSITVFISINPAKKKSMYFAINLSASRLKNITNSGITWKSRTRKISICKHMWDKSIIFNNM